MATSTLALLATSFSSLASLTAQQVDRDRFLLGAGGGVAIDRAGQVLGLGIPVLGDVRYAPDGAYWAPHRTNGQLRRVPVGGPTFTAFLTPPFLDMCVTPEGHALVVTGTPRPELLEFDLQAQRIATRPLNAIPQAVEVDEIGRAWVAIANNPVPLVQVVPRGTGTGGLIATAPGTWRVTDILADGRAGGSHVFIAGTGTNRVQQHDPRLNLVRSIAVGDDPVVGVDQLEIGPDGSVWANQRARGLFRIDPVTGVVATVLMRRVDLFGFDAEGALWIISDGVPFQTEVSGTGVEITARLSTQIRGTFADDPGGLVAATVLDPDGDADGDGVRNRDEVRARSNWLDAYSTPSLDLETRLDASAGGELVARLRGAPALGYLALGLSRGAPIAIPGVENSLLLFPSTLVGGLLPVTVPGELRLPVPASVATPGILWAQAIRFPIVGAPRFSDLEALRFGPAPIGAVDETFAGVSGRDDLRSSLGWDGSGAVRPVAVGGRGLLGSFDAALGDEIAPGVFVFDTDDQLFPARVTLFGRDIRVTDGVFEFSDFVVPAGVTVRFEGAAPAILKVRGSVRIDGALSLAGRSPDPGFDPSAIRTGGGAIARPGERGAAAGAGGGAGGDGGDGCDGNGAQLRFAGRAGEPIQVLGGSGYAAAAATTPGGGGALFPASGLDRDVQFNLFSTLSGQLAGGGGGGAFLGAGGAGRALQTFTGVAADLGPDSIAGAAVAFRPAPAGISSLEHYLVGGAGGGGGGSQPHALARTQIVFEDLPWFAGGAGAGGGGALALRSGGGVEIASGGRVSVAGGDAVAFPSQVRNHPSPGGGGSGGSVLIQVPSVGALAQRGEIDIAGGAGGQLDYTAFNAASSRSTSGAGGHGYVRVEADVAPSPAALGTVLGAVPGQDNVGVLTDRDAWSGVQSRFRPAATLRAPRWLAYEIRATIGGQPVVFSDDPANFNPANRPGQPLQFFVQGAELDGAGGVRRTGPWREFVAGANGLGADGADAVRFLLLFDNSVGATVEVDAVTIRYRD